MSDGWWGIIMDSGMGMLHVWAGSVRLEYQRHNKHGIPRWRLYRGQRVLWPRW